ncbi:unnamed protein product [[Candida] boidinii]|uniref:Unnamed protein product n=1 Tax=Candida boidinii TaxID=5477 RepID=A0A9W6SWY9_CANBO|nr:unnamed protein product [[Candida] boidinii]GMF99963.1 unnamed protein product [[Candida] boidinii]
MTVFKIGQFVYYSSNKSFTSCTFLTYPQVVTHDSFIIVDCPGSLEYTELFLDSNTTSGDIGEANHTIDGCLPLITDERVNILNANNHIQDFVCLPTSSFLMTSTPRHL